MIRQSLQQKLSQKLSPRQIQLMKLIQIPTIEMEERIKEEIESNPALEIVDQNEDHEKDLLKEISGEEEQDLNTDYEDSDTDFSIDEHSEENPFEYYYDGSSGDIAEDKNVLYKAQDSFYDILLRQVEMLDIDDQDRMIAKHIIGSIDDDGYLRRTALELSDDLAFKENVVVEEQKIKDIIQLIQTFEPSGVGAYDLQECLLLQLKSKDGPKYLISVAVQIINESFQEFSKKHYTKIGDRHKLSEEELKEALELILSLSPKPGMGYGSQENASQNNQYIYPDFFVTIDNDRVHITLNDRHIPHLRIAPDFEHMLMSVRDVRQKKKDGQGAEQFIRKNIDAARWFIDALQQRKETLLITMKAIVDKQLPFFLSGNPLDLRPMILKDIADEVGLDISTISRVSRSKYVLTQYGTYPIKYFFTDAYTNEEGEDISVINVKNTLRDLIENENKKQPFSDAQLTDLMNEKGYQVARRTVAKYRDQLQYPVAQMRREL